VLWFAMLMLEVVPRSKAIGFVVRAVLLGGEALVHTTGMMLVFVYAFAIVGFVVFPNLFQLRKPEVVDGTTQLPWENNRRVPCDTVWKCMIVILDQGLRKSDVGEAMDKIPWPVQSWAGKCDECPSDQVGITCAMEKECLPGSQNLWSWPQGKLWIRIVYTFFFFVMISAVVIQVIFGIIIDSFKRLREEREATVRDINSQCFVCGLDRNRFDSEAQGFRHHCKSEHNMWQYMNFLIHIREKPKDSLDGPETAVSSLMRNHDISFLPLKQAMSLKTALNPRQELLENLATSLTQAERTLKKSWRPILRKLESCQRLWAHARHGANSLHHHHTHDEPQKSVVLEIAQRLQWEEAYSLKI